MPLRYDRLGHLIIEAHCVSEAVEDALVSSISERAVDLIEQAVNTYWDWPREIRPMLRG